MSTHNNYGHYTGTLSHDPNSTLGRGTTFKKTDLSSSSKESKTPLESEGNFEMSKFSSTNEASMVEEETKVDLGALQALSSNNGSKQRRNVM